MTACWIETLPLSTSLQRYRLYVLFSFASVQSASAEPQAEPDLLTEERQHHRRVLNELIDIGADFARLLHQQARTQDKLDQADSSPAAPDLTLPDLAIAFDRIARAIRRTVALARKLAEPIQAPTTVDPTQTRIFARKRIIREVEDLIQRKPRGVEAETLHNELSLRLDSPDLEDDIENRPVADIIADICHDLGLANLPGSHLWKRRTPQDVAALYARAAMPRKPPGPVPSVRRAQAVDPPIPAFWALPDPNYSVASPAAPRSSWPHG